MTPYQRKIVTAGVLSVTGIVISYSWYFYDLSRSRRGEDSNRKLLAHLDTAKNEVQKRSVKRVIWQKIIEEDLLYSGEAVRTGPDSEAKIVFQAGTEVDLEPDSVVVIEDSDGKVNLDFVKGNLFVKGSGDGALSLKSGNTNIDLNNADLSLGRSEGKDLNVQVYRGVAQLTGDKSLTLDQSQQFIKVLSPGLNDKVFVRVDKKEPVIFSWQPLSPDYQIKIELGARREFLKFNEQVVSGEKGQLSVLLPTGTQYWRLMAVHKADPKQVHYSIVARLSVIADVPPKLLSPDKDALTYANPETKNIDFRWTNPSRLTKLELEVARDMKFSKVIFKNPVEDTGLFSIAPETDGDYFWRVSGLRPGTSSRVSSEIQKFILSSKVQLIPPELKSPQANARIPYESIATGAAFLSWKPVPGIGKYYVNVTALEVKDKTKTSLIDKEISGSAQVRIPAGQPGKYKWTMVSVDSEGKKSTPTEERIFFIEDLPLMGWVQEVEKEEYLYVTEKPSLKLLWKPYAHSAKIAKYRVVVQSVQGGEKKEFESGVTQYLADVNAEGAYETYVDALDAQGVALARTKMKTVNVITKPLLPPPPYNERMPASVTTQKNGSMVVGWNQIPAAKGYAVHIKSNDGKEVKTDKFQSTTNGTVKGLLPGTYKMSLSSIDEYGRVGPQGEEREVSVPEVSDLKAPGFKKLKIQ